MTTNEWAEHLGIPFSQLKEWHKLIPAGEDLATWALLNGKLSEAAYFPWAMKALELPFVSEEFFKITPDLVFWESVREKYPWSSALLPLAEWDGILLIGCVKPPEIFEYEAPHQFVLAQARNLDFLWKSFQPNPHVATKLGTEIRAVLKNAYVPPRDPSVAPIARQVAEKLVPAYREPPPPKLAVAPTDAPEGLQINLGAAPAAPGSRPETTPESESSDAPEGLFLSPDLLKSSKPESLDEDFSDSPDLLGARENDAPDGFESLKAFTINPQAAAAAAAGSHVHHDSENGANATVDQSNPDLAARTPPSSLLSQIKKAADDSREENQAPHETTHIVGQSIHATPLDSCRTLDELGQVALAHVMKSFEHAMILQFMDGELRPWQWTELLLSVKGLKPDPISLAEPSIFRIVSATRLPYHGYVVDTKTNAEFFNQFNRGALPKHVTVVPIFGDKEVIGMLLGLTDGEIAFKSSLEHMQALALEVGQHYARLSVVIAAA